VTSAYWDDRIAVNLKHQFFAAQAVLPDFPIEAIRGVGYKIKNTDENI
jgi:hypothetical protein